MKEIPARIYRVQINGHVKLQSTPHVDQFLVPKMGYPLSMVYHTVQNMTGVKSVLRVIG